MLILQPVIHETVWGTDLLSDLYDPECKHIGHLYSCNPEENGSNLIMNGHYKGRTLYEYLTEQGKNHTDLQFVIALVTPGENLSIQVHPSSGPHKKNESWLFLKKPASSFIYNGCKTTDKTQIERQMRLGSPDSVTQKLYIENGDYVYVQAGTLHAMTAGCIVYEIEELHGQTYRFYDYGRLDQNGQPRELQIEQALCHLRCENRSIAVPFAGTKAEEKYEVTVVNGGMYRNLSDKLECLTLIEGISALAELKIGMSVILEPNEICDLGSGKYIASR